MSIDFTPIYNRALRRNGSPEALAQRLLDPIPSSQLHQLQDHRYLAMMAKVVFQAGFVWRVIDHKWPDFESVFLGFDPQKLLLLSPEQVEAMGKNKRIVRNHQKINSVFANALYIYDQQQAYGSFANMVADWPHEDFMGLWQRLPYCPTTSHIKQCRPLHTKRLRLALKFLRNVQVRLTGRVIFKCKSRVNSRCKSTLWSINHLQLGIGAMIS